MKRNISIMIGGVQGEGVVSTGINLMKTFSSLGYYTYGNRNFSSRIKGGNTTITIHIDIEKTAAVRDSIDILLAMDLDTIDSYINLLSEEGILLYDSELKPDASITKKSKSLPFPIAALCKSLGAPTMKSTAAIASIGRLLNLPQAVLSSSIRDRYGKKGDEIVDKNLQILAAVYENQDLSWEELQLQLLQPPVLFSRGVMMGNDAIALGALSAGCRFIASYPITPASEIMEYLGQRLPNYGGIMLQVEDEIAAVNAIIGASYSGVRSLTATSGPGISLMLEGIGLAGMTEIPVVIVDAQRAGPSTGLPTKHEQSDLFTLYYGGHGEFPSIILSPSTIEDCFYETQRAFNLADVYQCPVILLSDLTLSLSPQTVDRLDPNRLGIDRGKLITLPQEDMSEDFKRYLLTSDGISPRVIPGVIGGVHHVTGLEHNELGRPMDAPENRRSMMDKRMRKTSALDKVKEVEICSKRNSTLFLTFGSCFGVLKAAAEATGNAVDYGKINRIKPLPLKELEAHFNSYEKIVIVENNYYGQLSKIIKAELGFHNKLISLVKYDGNPFTIEEIVKEIGGVCNGNNEGL